jgi:hypothetical protein
MMMAKDREDDKADSRIGNEAEEYPPSWVDRFTGWVDRRPGPNWTYYAGLGLALLLVQIIIVWLEGVRPMGIFLPHYGFLAAMISYFMALFPYLDNRADSALTTLRPTLKASEEEYSQLRYQLTTLPARPTLLASLAGVIAINLITALFGAPTSFVALAAISPMSAALLYFTYMVAWWVFGALLYHTVRTMRLINRIYTTHVRINLFGMSPLYAFSSVTALTAVSLTFSTYAWLAINLLFDPMSIGIAVVITVLGLATFAWPLLGIHRLLVKEKERLLEEGSRRLEATIADLHQRVDSGELEGMMDLNMTIAGLEMEQNALNRIPTWPWQPETVRLLVTALLLPLGLWVVQIVLQAIMGP